MDRMTALADRERSKFTPESLVIEALRLIKARYAGTAMAADVAERPEIVWTFQTTAKCKLPQELVDRFRDQWTAAHV